VRLRLSITVLAVAVALIAGCGRAPAAPVDNTADICGRWLDSVAPFISRGADAAPEAKAYQAAMSDAYAGKERPQSEMIAIQKAYWNGQEKAPRELARQATNPRLRAALGDYADELAGRATDVIPEFTGSASPVLQALTAICPAG
jgi:hypothetical protein